MIRLVGSVVVIRRMPVWATAPSSPAHRPIRATARNISAPGFSTRITPRNPSSSGAQIRLEIGWRIQAASISGRNSGSVYCSSTASASRSLWMAKKKQYIDPRPETVRRMCSSRRPVRKPSVPRRSASGRMNSSPKALRPNTTIGPGNRSEAICTNAAISAKKQAAATIWTAPRGRLVRGCKSRSHTICTWDPDRVPDPPRRGSGGEAACAPRDHSGAAQRAATACFQPPLAGLADRATAR